MMPVALLRADGSVAQQVYGYDPARDNPDGSLRAVEIERMGEPATHDLDAKSGRWRVNPARKAAHEKQARRATVSRGELLDLIEALEARVAVLEANWGSRE